MDTIMEKTVNVLLVEDSPSIGQQIRLFLQGDGGVDFAVEHVLDLASALETAEKQDFDVILLDLGLSDSSGLDTFTTMNKSKPDVPTIVFTGTDDEDVAIDALRMGAQDYLVKGYVDGKLLKRAVAYSIERKKLLTELRQSKEELSNKTIQLVQSEKMNALNDITAGVAHELNQPLRAIKNGCQNLVEELKSGDFDPSRADERLQRIEREVEKMDEVISHMRIFSRWSQTRAATEIKMDIPVNGALKIIGEQLKENGIDVAVEIDPTLAFIGDTTRFHQVMLNLIFNARDAVAQNPEDKGKKIIIRNRMEKGAEGEKSYVVYEISDNGAGMSQSVREKIFQPFFTDKAPEKGAGLGLSVVRQIVREHKGRIEVDSTEGEGSTFRVFLPA